MNGIVFFVVVESKRKFNKTNSIHRAYADRFTQTAQLFNPNDLSTISFADSIEAERFNETLIHFSYFDRCNDYHIYADFIHFMHLLAIILSCNERGWRFWLHSFTGSPFHLYSLPSFSGVD